MSLGYLVLFSLSHPSYRILPALSVIQLQLSQFRGDPTTLGHSSTLSLGQQWQEWGSIHPEGPYQSPS